MSLPTRFSLSVSLALLAACGNGDGPSNGDGGGNEDLGFAIAAHSPLPPIPFGGGTVFKNVKLVSVMFDGFPQEAAMKTFGDWVVGSSWYKEVGAEYGVGAGTHQLVHLAEPGPAAISSTQIGALLAARIDSQLLPAPTAETVYLTYFPPNTIVDGSHECTKYKGTYSDAYHSYEDYKDGKFAFAVVSSCPEITLDTLEQGAAHEIIEAATDPFQDGYAFAPGDPWYTLGSEIADNCTAPVLAEGHTVTRVWSNAAIAANNPDPCIPHSGPYFGVSASPDRATVAPGATAAFAITGWSTAAVDDFWVFIDPGFSTNFMQAGGPMTNLDVGKLNNGKMGHATITAPSNAPSGYSYAMRLCGADASRTTYFCRPITIDIP